MTDFSLSFFNNIFYKLRGAIFAWLYFKTSSPYLQQPHQSLTMITACPGLQYGWLPWMVLLFKPTKPFKRLYFESRVKCFLVGSAECTAVNTILQYHSNLAVDSWLNLLKSPLCALFSEIAKACCPLDSYLQFSAQDYFSLRLQNVIRRNCSI